MKPADIGACGATYTVSLQVELDASDLNLVTSTSTLAIAEHCKNLSV